MSLTVSDHSYLYQAKPFRVDVVDQFVTQSATRVDGWISFYWGAFHDYLSWPDAEAFTLKFSGWDRCIGINHGERSMILDILTGNPHVTPLFT